MPVARCRVDLPGTRQSTVSQRLLGLRLRRLLFSPQNGHCRKFSAFGTRLNLALSIGEVVNVVWVIPAPLNLAKSNGELTWFGSSISNEFSGASFWLPLFPFDFTVAWEDEER